jgi:hypothetical protein
MLVDFIVRWYCLDHFDGYVSTMGYFWFVIVQFILWVCHIDDWIFWMFVLLMVDLNSIEWILSHDV